MDRWDWTMVSGLLARHAAGYDRWLVDQGYAPLSRPGRMRQFDDLSRWLDQAGLAVEELTPQRAEQFLAARREAGHVTWVSRLSLRLPLRYRQQSGVMSTPKLVFTGRPVDRLLADYRVYLARERGLTPEAIRKYASAARLFLEDRERIDGLALERLTAADVSEFLARECPRRSISGARTLVAKLRALVRYLHVVGLIPTPLRWAVPGVADLRDRSLARGLEPVAVSKLLASCDRARSAGRRDYAILLVLVRLGLRGGEVASMRLEDVDWRHGELLVRGKGGRHDRLPLPTDVGQALVDYLRHRPRVASRAVFLRALAPVGPMTSAAVCNVVNSACRRAGLPVVGSHRLRHTAATEMLRAGAPLPEIAQVLRHRQLKTTMIYAKVDRASLRSVALPWPGGAA
jgi:integrase/recombinase XerD